MADSDQHEELKDFVLGALADDRRAAFEERLLADDDFAASVAAAEEDLYQHYADGSLGPDARARFEKTFAQSPAHGRRLAFARALRRHLDDAEAADAYHAAPPASGFPAFLARPVFAVVLLAAAVAAIGYILLRSDPDPGVVGALNKSQSGGRPSEGRFGGFDYAPVREQTRGGGLPTPDWTVVTAVKSRAIEAAAANENAPALRNLALAQAFAGNRPAAVAAFRRAIELDAASAVLHSDAAAIGLMATDIDEAADALEESSKAISLDQNLVEAYFNRALALERLGLTSRARVAWNDYLTRDEQSKWADEARSRRDRLATAATAGRSREAILSDFLDARSSNDRDRAWALLSRNRELITGKLIPFQLAYSYVRAAAAGNRARADELLGALEFAAALDEERAGDRFWTLVAARYRRLDARGTARLLEAQGKYQDGVKECLANRYEESAALLADASAAFGRDGHVEERLYCDFVRGYLASRRGRFAESDSVLRGVLDASRSGSFKWLEPQAGVWLVNNDITDRRISRARSRIEDASRVAAASGDLYSRQTLLRIDAELSFMIGATARALELVRQHLELGSEPDASPRERWRILELVARRLPGPGRLATTRAFDEEAIDTARSQGDPSFEYTSVAALAQIAAEEGAFAEAFDSLGGAERLAEGFEDAGFREKCIAYLRLLRGKLRHDSGDLAAAADDYTSAVGYYEKAGGGLYLYEAHRGRMMNYVAMNDVERVRAELPRLFEIYERYRAEIVDEAERNVFFDREQDVYDIAIGFEAGLGRVPEAFELSESSRARSLLDRLHRLADPTPTSTQPLGLDAIRSELPDSVQILQYAVLKERTVIWVVTRRGISSATIQVGESALEARVNEHLAAITGVGEDERLESSAAALYRDLVEPVRPMLDASKTLVIVPDKALARLSFATLKGQRRLLEEFALTTAPSASSFVACTRLASRMKATDSPVEVVGDPLFAADAADHLSPLPSAGREAEAVAGLYRGATLLRGEDATKEAVTRQLDRAAEFHFAGHYVVDPATPVRSALIVAGNDEASTHLTNQDIDAVRHARLRLVVLSACETGVADYYRGEGMTGAARVFIATGVPLVVASQWPVESEATAALMIRFHELRTREHLPVAEALRRAQLELAADPRWRSPRYWAAFTVFGGLSEY